MKGYGGEIFRYKIEDYKGVVEYAQYYHFMQKIPSDAIFNGVMIILLEID